MHSCIYEGRVRHWRDKPYNDFTYSLFMMYLDLSELEDVFRGRKLWSVDGLNIASFNRAYHLGDMQQPLDSAVRDLVYEKIGTRPEGPVRMLTQLRYFGYNFNPVSFYYCLDNGDSEVETIIVEIHNTPWGERFCYVLDKSESKGTDEEQQFCLSKQFHISPFMDMDISYVWKFTHPGETVGVHMSSFKKEKNIFNAELSMDRREITDQALNRMLKVYPFMNLKIISAIYWQALRLKLKGAPFFTHPLKRSSSRIKGLS